MLYEKFIGNAFTNTCSETFGPYAFNDTVNNTFHVQLCTCNVNITNVGYNQTRIS